MQWPAQRLKVRLHYAYKVRILVRCIRDCAVPLLRFCGLPTPQKTQWFVYFGMAPDWIRRMPTCYHCSTFWEVRHPTFISHFAALFQNKRKFEKSMPILKSFDKQYIKSIWSTACNEQDNLVASTYRKCHRCAMCCRWLRNLGKYAIKFNILNFFPRMRTS